MSGVLDTNDIGRETVNVDAQQAVLGLLISYLCPQPRWGRRGNITERVSVYSRIIGYK